MKTKQAMTTTEFELRDFPADVQDILKQRAVEQCRPIEDVIHDYIVETSRLINQTKSAA